MRRIGIDVGGTNTDAVLIEDDRVTAGVKTTTTEDITGGVLRALEDLVAELGEGRIGALDAVMIGTTHFTNAVVERARALAYRGPSYRASRERVPSSVRRLARGSHGARAWGSISSGRGP